MSYEVEQHRHGIVVKGAIPIDEFTALAKVWERQGWTQVHPGLAKELGSAWAITNKEHLEPWLAEARAAASIKANGDPELEWLYGPDTGLSSLTIFATLTRKHKTAARARLGLWGVGHYPADPDDFGRCRRLLQAIPEWRGRLAEVAEEHGKVWAALVREWDQIDALFAEEEPSGRAPKCYRLMEQIQESVR